MAYSAAALVPQFDGGSGFGKRWSYTTTDTLATVMASGYFTGRADSSANGDGLSIGDVIEVHVVNAVAIASRTSATSVTPIMVATNDGTTVTTTVASGQSGVVDTTATSLSITRALHSGRIITISSAAPLAVTLPQATGTGSRFKFVVQVAATGTSHTIKVANATDVMEGISWVLTTASANVIGYATSATSDTITINGSTLGGVVGDIIEIEDIKTGFFSVRIMCAATGSTATPFSATV